MDHAAAGSHTRQRRAGTVDTCKASHIWSAGWPRRSTRARLQAKGKVPTWSSTCSLPSSFVSTWNMSSTATSALSADGDASYNAREPDASVHLHGRRVGRAGHVHISRYEVCVNACHASSE